MLPPLILNGIKKLLAKDLRTFSIKDNSVFSNGPNSLTKNPSNCPILSNWLFDNFMLADKLFAKASRSPKMCALVNNNLWEKLFSTLESPTTFD